MLRGEQRGRSAIAMQRQHSLAGPSIDSSVSTTAAMERLLDVLLTEAVRREGAMNAWVLATMATTARTAAALTMIAVVCGGKSGLGGSNVL